MGTEDDVERTGVLTRRFDDALVYALQAHDTQVRKSTNVPYAAHLLGVASIVLEAGGSETEAIAALFHDIVEDQGGAQRRADVAARYGEEIASIVQECSAEDKTDDPGWRTRKRRYVDGIATISASALLVSLADKLYNARAILDDYRALGHQVWARFGADEPKVASILWYYDSLIDAYAGRGDAAPPRLLADLGRTIGQLTMLTRRPNCPECGAGDVALIGYGLPGAGDFETAAEKGIAIGGCVIEPDSPDFRCLVCGTGWPDPDSGHDTSW
jgi:HD domain